MSNKKGISKTSLLIGSALVAIMLQGCGEDDKVVTDTPVVDAVTADTQETTATTNTPNQAQEASVSAADILDHKLSVYIGCYNSSDRISDSIDRYRSWVSDMDVGPTGKERPVVGLYEINLKYIRECKAKVEEAAKLAPVTDLDKAAVAFADNALKTAENINGMFGYYEQQDYKDDDFKKGKEAHASLAESFKQFIESASTLEDIIEVVNNKRQLEHLAEIEKTEGEGVNFYRLSIIIQSKQIAKMLYQDDFSTDEAKVLIDQYNKTLESAKKYCEDPANEEKMKEMGTLTQHNLKNLIDAAQKFNKTAKERYRSVRDKKPIKIPGNAYTTVGTVENMGEEYNEVVRAFNR